MLSSQRHKEIIDILNSSGQVRVGDLSKRFNVSEMTIRRDLRILEAKGALHRVHGGATSSRGRSFEPPFLSRSHDYSDAKENIGKLAATLVKNGDSIVLDTGTTTLEIARNLTDKNDLTVMTPSYRIAGVLIDQPGITIMLPGGLLRPGELSLVGDITRMAFEQYHFDKLFLGVGGIDIDSGLTEYNLDDAVVKKAMIKCAKEVIVVADSSKFNRVTFASIAPISEVSCIVSDLSLEKAICDQLADENIKVVLG